MYPNYVLFSMDTNWGSPRLLRRCIDSGWFWLEENGPSKDSEKLYRMCARQLPNLEEFDSIYTMAAVNASEGCMNLATLMMKFNYKRPIETASISYESVFTYALQLLDINPESPTAERKVRRHPLVQKELIRQKEAILQLKTMNGRQSKEIQILKDKWANLNVGSLGIPMNPPETTGYTTSREDLENFIRKMWIRSYYERRKIKDYFKKELSVGISLCSSGFLFSDANGEISPTEFHKRTQDDSLTRLELYRWLHPLNGEDS